MFESRIQLVIACRAHDGPVLQFPNIRWTKIPAWHLKERTHLIKDDLLEHETLEFYKGQSSWGEDRRKTKLPQAHKHGQTDVLLGHQATTPSHTEPSLQNPTKPWQELVWLTGQRRHKLNKWSLRGITTWIAGSSIEIDQTLDAVMIKFEVLISMLTQWVKQKKELLINPPQLLYHNSSTYNIIN